MVKFYAVLNAEQIVEGISMLAGIVNDPKMIEVENLDVDLLYRKYENGQWSAEKFEPPAPVTGPSAEEQIAVLDERTVGMQAIDDFTLQAQATIDERTVGMQEIDDFTLLQVTDLQQQVDQLKADVAALKGGA